MILWEALKALFRPQEPEYPYTEYPHLGDAEAVRREWEDQQRAGTAPAPE